MTTALHSSHQRLLMGILHGLVCWLNFLDELDRLSRILSNQALLNSPGEIVLQAHLVAIDGRRFALKIMSVGCQGGGGSEVNGKILLVLLFKPGDELLKITEIVADCRRTQIQLLGEVMLVSLMARLSSLGKCGVRLVSGHSDDLSRYRYAGLLATLADIKRHSAGVSCLLMTLSGITCCV